MSSEEPKASMSTLRDVLDAVLGMATSLPRGLDTPAEFGVCDGSDLQILDDVDMQVYPAASREAGQPAGEPSVLIRVHDHPGSPGSRGRLLLGVAPHSGGEAGETA
jgi:hypothetical protein